MKSGKHGRWEGELPVRGEKRKGQIKLLSVNAAESTATGFPQLRLRRNLTCSPIHIRSSASCFSFYAHSPPWIPRAWFTKFSSNPAGIRGR